jgi:iron complex transport system permease protein
VATVVGSVRLDLGAIVSGLGTDRAIFFRLRLPRIALAAIVGAALASSGAALQPMLRNPLASPDIIGVSGGAALGAVSALALLPASPSADFLVPLLAFVGASLSSAVVYRLSLVNRRLEPTTQLLVGVIFNTFAAAAILLITAIVDVARSQTIVFWLMGGLAAYPVATLVAAALVVSIGAAILTAQAHALNLLALGDDTAAHLGVDLARTRRRVFGVSALLVGTVVSLSGVISFVGLIVPHLLRRSLGSDNRLLIPASFLAGAAFLVTCDALCRSLIAPAELPVGSITALTGGPFFIYLLRRRPRHDESAGL